MTNYRLR